MSTIRSVLGILGTILLFGANPSQGQLQPADRTVFIGICETGSNQNDGQPGYIPLKGLGEFNYTSHCGLTWEGPTVPGGIPNTSSGTLANLWVISSNPQFSQGGGTIQVFVNGALTSLACNIMTDGQPNGHGEIVCKESLHKVKIQPGDTISAGISIQSGNSTWGDIRVAFGKD